MEIQLKPIGHIRSGFPSKFGIPRQSGLAGTKARIVLEGACRNPDVVRGLEEYSHIWLLWGFSGPPRGEWSPTVRPPKLGGNQRVGVFATRSPYRPNPVGLSCVRLLEVRTGGQEGVSLLVEGADLMDGTPIYDIKPYLPYVDSHPQAAEGFTGQTRHQRVAVEIPEPWRGKIPEGQEEAVRQILSLDPRPGYQEDPERVYGLEYENMDIRFRVQKGTLTVCEIARRPEQEGKNG